LNRIVKSSRRFFPFLFSLNLLLLTPTLLIAAPVKAAHVEAELISEIQSIQPGQSFWVALRLKMDQDWHTYWKNPGDSGLATTVEWELPEGLVAGPLEWPSPQQIKFGHLLIYGYEGEVFLLTEILTSQKLEIGSEATLIAHVDWLACAVDCIPGKADLTLTLPVLGEVPKANDPWVEDFARTRVRLPLQKADWQIKVSGSEKYLMFRIEPPDGVDYTLSSLLFFPDSDEIVDHSAQQGFRRTPQGYELLVPRSTLLTEKISKISGILVAKEGWRGIDSEQALEIERDVESLDLVPVLPFITGEVPLGMAILFAFIGGLILNLMPCVLPVLSLKVLGFVEEAGTNSKKVGLHGLSFAGGVLVSFWILAGILLLLRTAGAQVGWGFQLQSPFFLVFLAALFFMLGLNLFGVFEIGTSLTALGGTFASSTGSVGSFFSGVLATVVATPCTAPFMGTALGFALTQSAVVAFSVFTFLALGMACPYLLLSFSPGLIRMIPKPGPWMKTLKRVLGFFLIATVLWLVWILSFQVGSAAIHGLLISFGILAISAWIYGRKRPQATNVRERNRIRVISFVIFFVGLVLAVVTVHLHRGISRPAAVSVEGHLPWQPYSEEVLLDLRKQGQPVFIDFTAAWCLTCQVNERIALQSPKVIKKFEELGVIAMKADWTSRDEKIAKALAEYGRSSIPLYVLYGPNREVPPQILPEIITPHIVLDALEKLKEQSERDSV